MSQTAVVTEDLQQDNQRLLEELADAYRTMEALLEQTSKEREIAYQELEQKFKALERLYTDLSSKENMLLHLEKLSSRGQFALEILRELQSPLTAIAGHAQLAVMLEDKTEVREEIRQIPKQIDRMLAHLRKFYNMAYRNREEYVLFDINKSLSECVSTLQIIKPQTVAIETRLCGDRLTVKGDPYQINQAFLNLAKNAFLSMKRRGKTLTISSQLVSGRLLVRDGGLGPISCQPAAKWESILRQTEDFALVEFTDDGIGMPPARLKNALKESLTLNGGGDDTGVALSISSDIAIRHRGNLAAKCKLARGTTYQLAFPLAAESRLA